jgi:hypothetical protein
LYRHHRKASPANKLVSLYLIDAIAREAKSRQKKADKEGKGAGTAAGSTTPAESPPSAAAGPSAGDGDFASFLRKLEAVLSKIVLDNWENGLPEHRVRYSRMTRHGGAVADHFHTATGKSPQGARYLDQGFYLWRFCSRQDQHQAPRSLGRSSRRRTTDVSRSPVAQSR